MNNEASMKNFKRLYELSGWFDIGQDGYNYYHTPDAPYYTTGYLLRKLEPLDFTTRLDYCHHSDGLRNYCASYDLFFAYAKTPEDALASLTIELFEEGGMTAQLKGSKDE